MVRKYTWDYYTERDDSKGRTDPKKRAIIFNAGVYEVETREYMFAGDLDEYRLSRIRDDTAKTGRSLGCTLIMSERDQPLFVVCNGKIHEVEHDEWKLPSDVIESDEIRGEMGLSSLFG